MLISQLAQTLQKLEETSKRLEITSVLTELIANLEPSEIDKASYLLMGQLNAPFANTKFNIADRMMAKIIEYTYSTPQKAVSSKEISDLYSKAGDLGSVVYELAKDKSADLTITEVHEKLLDIAQTEGTGSQDNKIKKTALLLKQLDSVSAKFVVRIILGTTRLGFTELTLIDALAQYLGNKSFKEQIEATYNTHPDIGLIAKKIRSQGIKGIATIKIETGVPILAQKPQRMGADALVEALDRMKTVWAEFKFDGTRVQLHIDRNKDNPNKNSEQTDLFGDNTTEFFVNTYTRNLENTTHQYPDLVEAAVANIKADSAIIDGEAIGYDKKTGKFLPFQETIQRKRKHDIAESAKNIPLKYFVFDLLYLNGESLVNKTLRERKSLLKQIIKPNETIAVDEYLETSSLEELQEYYEVSKEKSLEGLIVKKPDDPYQAGARSYSWVKIKRADEMLLEDSVECVVLGYYAGRGVRSKFGIGGFLAAILDKTTETYKTITKVGTGLTDVEWEKLKSMCDKHKTNKLPSNIELDKIYQPDVMVLPKIVVELGADEISVSPSHSSGYALRFPRLIKFREDKAVTDITTLQEIKQMFSKQKKN